jgi:ribonuclease D
MSRRVEWCRSSEELSGWIDRIGTGPLALDTEADSLHHYPEKVCLIQLSFGEVDLLVDPLSGADPAVLAPTLLDPALPKLLHGADYDLRILNRDYGLEFRGLFDTMIAARLVGTRQFGLAALLVDHFEVVLDKSLQRADWSHRPLSAAMETYAAMDTRHLAALVAALGARLDDLGRRTWAEEEFEILERVRWTEKPNEDAFRRIKGSGTLDPRSLGVLRELVAVRELLARRADRPPFKIMSNDRLLAIARRRPTDRKQLDSVLSHKSGRASRWSDDLLACVERAMSIPETELPARRRRSSGRVSESVQTRLRELSRQRDAVAQQLDLEPSVLAPRAVLEEAVIRSMRGEDPRLTPGLRRWQREQLEEPLSALTG